MNKLVNFYGAKYNHDTGNIDYMFLSLIISFSDENNLKDAIDRHFEEENSSLQTTIRNKYGAGFYLTKNLDNNLIFQVHDLLCPDDLNTQEFDFDDSEYN